MTGFAIVTTTLGSEPDATDMARALVEARLAACVQVLPIASVYRWHSAIETAAEHLLLCKIAEPDFAAVRDMILRRHPYDLPEIVMTAIAGGSEAYLAWLATETRRD